MRNVRFSAAALAFFVAGCQPDLTPEVAQLRMQLDSQQAQIAELASFVDAQATLLSVCQETMAEISSYLVNTSTLGLFSQAGAKWESIGECTDAFAAFNVISDARRGL
jgi:hypothetical protein